MKMYTNEPILDYAGRPYTLHGKDVTLRVLAENIVKQDHDPVVYKYLLELQQKVNTGLVADLGAWELDTLHNMIDHVLFAPQLPVAADI